MNQCSSLGYLILTRRVSMTAGCFSIRVTSSMVSVSGPWSCLSFVLLSLISPFFCLSAYSNDWNPTTLSSVLIFICEKKKQSNTSYACSLKSLIAHDLWVWEGRETAVPLPWAPLHPCAVLALSSKVPRPRAQISPLVPDSDRWNGGVQDDERRGKRSFGKMRVPCWCSSKKPWVGWQRKIAKAKCFEMSI